MRALLAPPARRAVAAWVDSLIIEVAPVRANTPVFAMKMRLRMIKRFLLITFTLDAEAF
jgi:hypothetical protein